MKNNIFKNPENPPANFVEYMMKLHSGWIFQDALKRGIFYPCQECNGTGRMIDPQYIPCYESRTEYIDCTYCNATGHGKEETYFEAYKVVVEQNKKAIQALKKDNETLTSLLKKINPEELALIYRVTGTDLSNIR